jgi:cholesterol oxidase
VKTFRIFRPWNWARETIILLCMQALDSHIDMAWERPWW